MNYRTVLIIAAAFLLVSIGQACANESPDLTINLSVSGTTSVEPNMARIILGVRADGASATEAMDEANRTGAAIVRAAADFVKRESIKTVDFSLHRREQWDDDQRRNVLIGFRAVHIYDISIQDLDHVAPLLDAAVDAGANEIRGIHYAAEDTRAAEETAYRRALEEAWWKARLIADSSGFATVHLVDVDETASSVVSGWSESRTLMLAESADAQAPGQLQITVNLRVEFRAQP